MVSETHPNLVTTILAVPTIVALHLFVLFWVCSRSATYRYQTLYHSDMQTFRVCRGVAASALPVHRSLQWHAPKQQHLSQVSTAR